MVTHRSSEEVEDTACQIAMKCIDHLELYGRWAIHHTTFTTHECYMCICLTTDINLFQKKYCHIKFTVYTTRLQRISVVFCMYIINLDHSMLWLHRTWILFLQECLKEKLSKFFVVLESTGTLWTCWVNIFLEEVYIHWWSTNVDCWSYP